MVCCCDSTIELSLLISSSVSLDCNSALLLMASSGSRYFEYSLMSGWSSASWYTSALCPTVILEPCKLSHELGLMLVLSAMVAKRFLK